MISARCPRSRSARSIRCLSSPRSLSCSTTAMLVSVHPLLGDQTGRDAIRSAAAEPPSQEARAAAGLELGVRLDGGQRLVDRGDGQPITLVQGVDELADPRRDSLAAFALGQADN